MTELLRRQVTLERGDESVLGAAHRVAVVAHWSVDAALTRSFRELVSGLTRHGYAVVVVSASPAGSPLRWGSDMVDAVVLRKPNIGYDFGSWAVALDRYPCIATADQVILANDSMVGPFTDMTDLLERFNAASTDVWALTDTWQYFHHLQSYFLGFRNGVLAEAPLARFWADIREEPTKWDVINNGELRLSRLLRREAYSWSCAVGADAVVPRGENPVIKGWWRLLELEFPFVKREVIARPEVAPRAEWVGREVEATFGVRLSEWL